MHKLIYIILAIFLLIALSCTKKHPKLQPENIELPNGGHEVINGINNFGINLLKEVNNGNSLISPFSITTLLTVLYDGAAGDTKSGLAALLGISHDINPGLTYKTLIDQLPAVDKKYTTVNIANALWIKNDFPVKDQFKEQCSGFFGAKVFNEPFDQNTIEKINDYVAEQTKGKIKHITDKLDGSFALLNAIYFYGSWNDRFDANQTTTDEFYIDSTNTVAVPTMHGIIDEAGRYYNDTIDICELYYGRGNFALTIILPPEKTGIEDFVEQLTIDKWNQWMNNIHRTYDLDVSLPKFTFEKSYDLNGYLQGLGLTEAFDPADANFEGITEKQLWLSQTKHKTFIEVNEKGTEAAAATFIGMATSALPDFFVVNRPFVFAIRETTTGLVLFLGIVKNPLDR